MTVVVGLLAGGEHTFVELSPHPVLAPAITDTLARLLGGPHSAVITTLHRDHPDLDALTAALARLHTHGHSPSWSALYPHAHTVALPTYPFEHRPYWLAPCPGRRRWRAGLDRAEHPLLGAVTELADQDQVVVSRAVVDRYPGLAGRPSSPRQGGVPRRPGSSMWSCAPVSWPAVR